MRTIIFPCRRVLELSYSHTSTSVFFCRNVKMRLIGWTMIFWTRDDMVLGCRLGLDYAGETFRGYQKLGRSPDATWSAHAGSFVRKRSLGVAVAWPGAA